MDIAIKLDVTGTLDPEQTFLVCCMEWVSKVPEDKWDKWASRVETMIEMSENVSCQRVTTDAHFEDEV